MKLLLKYAISLTLLLPFVSGMSQNNYHPITDGCIWSVSNMLFASNGDTVINGISYLKIYKPDVNQNLSDLTNDQFFVAIRNDVENKRVYALLPPQTFVFNHDDYFFLDTYQEVLLYDFSIQVGDTVVFYAISPQEAIRCTAKRVESTSVMVGWEGYSGVTHHYNPEDSLIIMLDGTTRHQFFLEKIEPLLPSRSFVWIEGIGSLNGFYEAPQVMNTDFGTRILLCYSDSTGLMFQTGYDFDNDPDDCFNNGFGGGITSRNSTMTVWPNPVTDVLTVSLSNAEERIRHIELHNITGLCVLRHFLEPEEEDTFQLHVNCLPSGVYILNCYGERTCKTTKIVKL